MLGPLAAVHGLQQIEGAMSTIHGKLGQAHCVNGPSTASPKLEPAQRANEHPVRLFLATESRTAKRIAQKQEISRLIL